MERHDEGRSFPSAKDLFLWGCNSDGQLGFGYAVDERTTYPRKLRDPHNVPNIMWNQIECGLYYNAALSINGELFTWGWGYYGQLGHGDRKDRSVPTKVEIPGGEAVVKVSCGMIHTAAVTASGKLFTWYVCNCNHSFYLSQEYWLTHTLWKG